MPFVELATHKLHYRIDGERGPWLLLCNSLGTDLQVWNAQVCELSDRFRIVRYDARGHGLSTGAQPPYSIDELGADTLALLDALTVERAHICGLSIGGLVGQWLALNAPQRVDGLVLCATATRIGTAEGWSERISQVQTGGLHSLSAATAQRWFTPAFAGAHRLEVDRVLASFVGTSSDAYVGCCVALADTDFGEEIGSIKAPVLTISGADDPVCPPSALQALADSVANGCHISLPGRHMVNVESSRLFNAGLAGFLPSAELTPREQS